MSMPEGKMVVIRNGVDPVWGGELMKFFDDLANTAFVSNEYTFAITLTMRGETSHLHLTAKEFAKDVVMGYQVAKKLRTFGLM